MVVNIYNIILKFIGVGIFDKYQAHVNIYDINNKKIYEGKTYSGQLCLNLKSNKIYKLYATCHGEKIFGSFYVSCIKNEYVFAFNRGISSNTSTITFLLTDANYNNLPIEKGKMFFVKSN